MAKLIPFPLQPEHSYSIIDCAGCSQPVTDDYWEVDLPTGSESVHHIALCGNCYKDAQRHGIFS